MKTWLISVWDSFRGSFFFSPLLLTLAALLLSASTTQIDRHFGSWVIEFAPWITSTPESARIGLSTLAGAMMTVAGVVFSVTAVALSMTSSQYGSRLLRSFMENATTQFAMGTFVGTSVYCLAVLRDIRSGGTGEQFVPHLAVAIGVVLAVLSVGVLFYFIHQVSLSVQAPYLVRVVAADLDDAIMRLYPVKLGEGPPPPPARGEVAMQLAALDEDFAVVSARREGYLQAVDTNGLLQAAGNCDVVVQLECTPGDFVVSGSRMARVWPSQRNCDELETRLNEALIVGRSRTPRQDVRCAVSELVEVAVRALSPGINDPFTAVICIDWLAATLSRLAMREVPSPYRFDEHGRLRVVAGRVDFPDVLAVAFDQIRQHAVGNVTVSLRLLDALRVIASSAQRDADRLAIANQAEMIDRACVSSVAEPVDRENLRREFEKVRQALQSQSESPTGEVPLSALDDAAMDEPSVSR